MCVAALLYEPRRIPFRGSAIARLLPSKENVSADSPGLVVRLFALLEQHGSLGYEQVAALLEEPPNEVRETLSRLRGLGFVEALTVGEAEAHIHRSVSYWRLSDAGREELSRLRGIEPRSDD